MHKLPFVKMNGAGNDFVVLDNRAGNPALDRAALAQLCDRHRGVGADGVLVVEPPAGAGADFRMRYYNADGGEAEMCGNGARCFARFASTLDVAGRGASGGRGQLTFETPAGLIRARIEGEEVALDMSDPRDGADCGELRAAGQTWRVAFFDTGVPHAVVLAADLESVDVPGLGAALRHHERFAPRGTNVDFVQTLGPREIAIRTFERGVEAETLACGTGCVAAALAHAEVSGLAGGPVAVRVRGGETLRIGFERTGAFTYRKVTLTGPADIVFRGEIALG